jgi:hypothetical protein
MFLYPWEGKGVTKHNDWINNLFLVYALIYIYTSFSSQMIF